MPGTREIPRHRSAQPGLRYSDVGRPRLRKIPGISRIKYRVSPGYGSWFRKCFLVVTEVDVFHRIDERFLRHPVFAAQSEDGPDGRRVGCKVAREATPVGEQQLVGL